MVLFKTNHGDITIKLFEDKAPETVANFLNYVKEGFYDGTIFHRVIPNFMIQGGGMTADMNQKETKAAIKNEADNGLKNTHGTLAMARTNDPHSATSQFFINVKDNGFLDFTSANAQGYGYCVFGEVSEGLDVVKAIEQVETGNHGYHQDVPTDTVLIESASVID